MRVHTVLKNGFWVAATTEIAKSQTSDDFDILIVVSKAKFEKKLNGQTRFCQDRPNSENLLLYTANFVYKSVSNFVYISRGQIKEEICIHERSTQR